MDKKLINISRSDGNNLTCLCIKPKIKDIPAILIINENFELNNWMKATALGWVEQGFLIIIPDISHNIKYRYQSKTNIDTELRRNCNLKQSTNYEAAITDLTSIITEAKAFPDCNGKVGIIGYSNGATLAYLSAVRLPVDVVVGYYGAEIIKFLAEGKNIMCPLLLHMSENDTTLDVYNLNKIQAALIGKGNISIYTYNAEHSFANSEDEKLYLPEAANLALERTNKILNTLK